MKLLDMSWCLACILLGLCGQECSGALEAMEQRLYTDLFNNYSTSIRPIPVGGNFSQQIYVHARFGIAQIEGLNEKNQQLTTHGFITLVWNDGLLLWDPKSYGGIDMVIVKANEVWLPEVTPVNSVSGATELMSLRDDTRVRIYPDGTIIWIPAMKMKTTCLVDVTDFPYDKQECIIRYANWMYTAPILNFTADPVVQLAGIDSSLEWTLTSSSAFVDFMYDPPTTIYPILNMKVNLERNPRFFEINVMLPAMLLSFLLIPMFLLPVDSGEKVSLGVTLMLAYSIFLLMMTDVTPKSGTTPRLTIAILVCTMFSGMGIFFNVITINIHHHHPDTPVPKWIKRLVLGKIGQMLCRMKYWDENEVMPFKMDRQDIDSEYENNNKQNEKTMMIKLGKEYDHRGDADLAAILEHVKYFRMQADENDMVTQNRDDWHKVARVMDRMFLAGYLLFFVCYVMAVLVIKFKS